MTVAAAVFSIVVASVGCQTAGVRTCGVPAHDARQQCERRDGVAESQASSFEERATLRFRINRFPVLHVIDPICMTVAPVISPVAHFQPPRFVT